MKAQIIIESAGGIIRAVDVDKGWISVEIATAVNAQVCVPAPTTAP